MARLLLGPKFAPSAGGGGAGGGALQDYDDADLIVATGGQPLAIDALGTYVQLNSQSDVPVLSWTDHILTHNGDTLEYTTAAELANLICPSGRQRVIPTAADFSTWNNQLGGTITDIAGYGFDLEVPLTTTTYNLTSCVRAVPSGNFSVGFGFTRNYHGFDYSSIGLCVIGANGKIAMLISGNSTDAPGLSIQRAASHTVGTNRLDWFYEPFSGCPAYMRVTYDGTYLRWYASEDGMNWGCWYKHTTTDAFQAASAPAYWGPIIRTHKYNSSVQDCNVGMGIWDWSETI